MTDPLMRLRRGREGGPGLRPGESADECLERRIGEERRIRTESVPLPSGRARSSREGIEQGRRGQTEEGDRQEVSMNRQGRQIQTEEGAGRQRADALPSGEMQPAASLEPRSLHAWVPMRMPSSGDGADLVGGRSLLPALLGGDQRWHDQGERDHGLLSGLIPASTPLQDPVQERGSYQTPGTVRGPVESPLEAPNPFWSPAVRRIAWDQDQSRPREGRTEAISADAIEELRQRCLESAAAQFREEVMRLQGSDHGSYRTASSGMLPPAPPPPPTRPAPVGNWVWVARDEGRPSPPPPPPPCPPPDVTSGSGNEDLGHQKLQAAQLSEALRNLELPALPQLGGEGSALQFGDWVTIATPLMCDISNTAGSWWDGVLSCSEKAYLEWLKATPVQKLRLKPELPDEGTYNPRVEQRGISMLLAALPDQLRRRWWRLESSQQR